MIRGRYKMKLLLTSAGFEKNPKIGKKFLEMIGKSASKIKVIFVPTASEAESYRGYIEDDRKNLLKLGIKEANIKTLCLDHEIDYLEVENYNVIHVCGGNTFYLLKKVRESGFDKIIKKFIKSDGIYMGISAGSILMGPNIEIAKLGDKNVCGMTDFTGLNYTDVAIFPHYNEKESEKVEEFKKKVDYPVLALTDNQALLIFKAKLIMK